MTWIDDDKAELQRQKQSEAELKLRERQIAAESGAIYDDLWNEIIESIDEAENKGLPRLLTNGSAFARKIIVPVKPLPHQSSTNPKEFLVKLMKNQQGIAITGPDLSILFSLDLCEDKVVRIKHEGEHKNSKDAAKAILRP